ncbi:MAG: HNH endonuclease [Planctomycetales bacterium]|nr:HNH endonuclease [Planctomycetales bacterium]
MPYRITKDCGASWEHPYTAAVATWGVSERQLKLAKAVAVGDIFLHFVDCVQAWAGHSEVIGPLQPNEHEEHADWKAALPWVIPIEKRTWLTRDLCVNTQRVDGLSHAHFHRQVTFSAMQNADDGKRIAEAIDAAASASPGVPSEEFLEKWNQGAEGYFKQIVKDLAQGACWLCGATAKSWMRPIHEQLGETSALKLGSGFLDAAHIEPHSDGGSMNPDNLRALCPNCHHVVDRLPEQERQRIFKLSEDERKKLFSQRTL